MQKVILMCTMAHPRVAQCVRHINSWPAPAAVSPNTGRRMYPAPSQNHRIGEHGCYDPPPPGTRAREDFFPIGSILLRSAVCPHRSATASSSAAAPGKRHPRPQVSASRRRRSPHRTRPARRGVPAGATAHRGGQSPRDEDLVESHSPTDVPREPNTNTGRSSDVAPRFLLTKFTRSIPGIPLPGIRSTNRRIRSCAAPAPGSATQRAGSFRRSFWGAR